MVTRVPDTLDDLNERIRLLDILSENGMACKGERDRLVLKRNELTKTLDLRLEDVALVAGPGPRR